MQLKHTRVKTLFLALGLSATMSTGLMADTTFVTDQDHTEVMFGWSHAGVSTQNGEFTTATGTLELGDSLETSTINVEIDASSVSTGVEALDKHLKSEDFLHVEKFPMMTFTSSSVKMTGEKSMEVEGDLTIHGVTQPVTLITELTHQGEHPLGKAFDYYQGDWIAFKATTESDHQAFGVGSFSTGPIYITINSELKAK